jgi:hypothetical protein
MKADRSTNAGFAVLVVLVMSFILSVMLTTLMTVTYTLHADNRRAEAVLQERADELEATGTEPVPL